MTTFEEAREIVTATIAPSWGPDNGTFYVSPDGYEDATHWHVLAGARECLVDGNMEYVRMDGPACLVDKYTGELALLQVLGNWDRLDAMTPVSTRA